MMLKMRGHRAGDNGIRRIPVLEDREGMDVAASFSTTGIPNRHTMLSRQMDDGLGLVPQYKDLFKEVTL